MCSRAYMLSLLACFMSLRAHISYKLAVLKYLTCLRAWYPSLTGVWQGSKCASKGLFKKYLINEGGGKFTKKSDEKWNRGWVWCQTIFAAHFFLKTQFLLLLISLIGSNNITVSNNKKYPKGYMCLWDSYNITFKVSQLHYFSKMTC